MHENKNAKLQTLSHTSDKSEFNKTNQVGHAHYYEEYILETLF